MQRNNLKLLAVDDDASSAELVVRIAERCGYDAFATSESRGVMNLVATLHPDVVAVDISMPHLDAIELFKLLAAANYGGHVIIVSGQDESVLKVAAHAAVVAGLATPHVHQKPLNLSALRQSLNAFLPARSA